MIGVLYFRKSHIAARAQCAAKHETVRIEFDDGSSFAKVQFDGSGRVLLEGGDGNDVIYSPGGTGSYYLRGFKGDDTLVATTDGAGSNFLAGRQGSDTYVYYAAAGNTIVSWWGEDVNHGGTDVFRSEDIDLADVTFTKLADQSPVDGDVLEAGLTDGGQEHYLRPVPTAKNGRE
ncbi:hypothetical protein [uncultured Ruegeria sp.]|uniref:hypothetical protein n=1 Tax=uncultured Ruegeria sp. TaxID=259304 RepID=UPI002616565B|nr:hypothetical protein [uncultured Ruegeria sp.]